MANADVPNGFKPFGRLLRTNRYIAAATIYPGDAVTADVGGSSTSEFKSRVIAGSDTGALLGVALNYATVGQSVLVADDPNQMFVGQADEAEIATNADLNYNANILSTSGNTTFKASRMEIDSSDLANTATHQLKLLGLAKRQDGKNAYGAFAEVIFIINNHLYKGGTGTQGV